MRRIQLSLLSVAVLALAACASGGPLVTGTPRPAIDPSQVRFYYDKPAGAEEIAVIDANSGAFTYGNQNKTNAVMQKLREQAAQLGANGVIYRGAVPAGGGGGVSVGAGGGRVGGSGFSGAGVGVNISPQQKYAEGLAIYVANPPPEAAPAPADATPAQPR